MKLDVKQTIWIFGALAALMLVTRHNHFGSAVSLPDASLAVFFLAGFVFPSVSRLALLAFAFLLLEAGSIDYYATQIQGVSDWCITPAYWFLIPTYASLWLGGAWLAPRQQSSWRGLAVFAGVAWLASTAAFVISNASFFWFSGRVTGTSTFEYASGVAQYYLPYLAGSFGYLAVAALVYALFNLGRKELHA